MDGSLPLEISASASAPEVFEISNVPNAGAWVVDARFDERAALVPTESMTRADGTTAVRFVAQSGGSGRYLVVPVGQENRPVSVSKRQVKAIGSTAYLAVGPSQFGQGVQPLLAHHAKEGLRGAFVDQEQLFDYYNYGRYGPAGIQNAVRAIRPQYLLLLGADDVRLSQLRRAECRSALSGVSGVDGILGADDVGFDVRRFGARVSGGGGGAVAGE